MLKSKKLLNLSFKALSYKFVRHYLYPFFIRKKKEAFDSEKYFNSWYNTIRPDEFEDGKTVALNYNDLLVRYHYKAVENSILEFLIKREVRPDKEFRVLDIGSGTGHWIDFYLDELGAGSITGIDISKICCEHLKHKYQNNKCVTILNLDISKGNVQLPEQFDIINAVGIMFHIVEDSHWEQAVKNLANHLTPNGYLIVGGQFGLISRNVQFHNDDIFNTPDDLISYSSMSDILKEEARIVKVNKRIRSRSKWRNAAKKANLKIEELIKTRENKSFITPENNILVLSKIRTNHD